MLAVLATRRSATVSAVGLATAAMAANAVAVVSTVVFARLLGTDGYGALAALLNLSVILFVPGLALQAAAAREGALGRLGAGGELAATVARWRTRLLLAATVVVACAAVLARGPLAALLERGRGMGRRRACPSRAACGCSCASSAGSCRPCAPTARRG